MNLPALLGWPAVHERLQFIFPQGLPERAYLVRESSARTVFVALYVGAIEGTDRWIAPRHVVRMSDAQAAQQDDIERLAYHQAVSKAKAPSPPGRWYADNTREPLRDEVIRQGLVPANAMIERGGLPLTSPLGRYALRQEFAALFDPGLTAIEFETAAMAWRGHNLSAAALARAALVRTSALTATGNIAIQLPVGPSIILPPGPSQQIMKAVVEVFAPNFLGDPRVVWVSDSGSKRPFRDAPLERSMQITLNAAQLLPDVVLVDLAPPGRPGRILIVFVEVVASDGPVTEQRKQALLNMIRGSPREYQLEDAAFVTAYADRSAGPARRTLPSLAWRSFAWFVSEPDRLIQLHDESTASRKLAALLQ